MKILLTTKSGETANINLNKEVGIEHSAFSADVYASNQEDCMYVIMLKRNGRDITDFLRMIEDETGIKFYDL